MLDGIKTSVGQLFKDFDKAPGWGYLLAAVFLWLHLFRLNDKIDLPAWITIPIPVEVIAIVVTFVLYQLGDAIDEFVFKERVGDKRSTRPCFKAGYQVESGKAQEALGVGESGLYSLATNLAAAAEKERGKVLVYFSNEMAKFMRSLFFLLGLLGIFYLLIREFSVGVMFLVSAVIAFISYPWLKVLHVKRLYKLAEDLTQHSKRYNCKETNGVRLYFWNRKLVTAVHLSQIHPQHYSVCFIGSNVNLPPPGHDPSQSPI